MKRVPSEFIPDGTVTIGTVVHESKTPYVVDMFRVEGLEGGDLCAFSTGGEGRFTVGLADAEPAERQAYVVDPDEGTCRLYGEIHGSVETGECEHLKAIRLIQESTA